MIDTQSLLSLLLDILARQEGHRRLRLTSLWLCPNARSATRVDRTMGRVGMGSDVAAVPSARRTSPLLARGARILPTPLSLRRSISLFLSRSSFPLSSLFFPLSLVQNSLYIT